MSSTFSLSAWRQRRKEKRSNKSKDAPAVTPAPSPQPTDATPPPSISPKCEDGQSNGQPTLSKPYADSYELWAEATKSLTESERQSVDLVMCHLDRGPSNRKGLVVDVQEKIDNAFKGQQQDSTTRRIIEKSVSLLSDFASVGDVAVSFDPVHAALPWAAVRSVLVLLIAHSELRDQLLTGMAQVASLLVQCDTYHQLYMAPDPTLRPPEATLDKMRTSIVQCYAKTQIFLAFAVQLQQSKMKIDAAFKLDAARGHVNALSESQGRLQRAGDDYEKHCQLLNRENVQELLKLMTEFPRTIQDQVQLVLEQISAEEQLRILEWVSPIPHGKHHMIVREARTSGTCEWLLDHEKFTEWEDSPSSMIMWLQGSPGAGKTFLTSKIIDHTQARLEKTPNQEGFAYFYCNRNEEERRRPLSVLRSYVRQLSTTIQNPRHMRKQLQQFCSEARLKGSDLGLEVCKDQLLESVNLYSQTTIVLDALDECDPASRWQLVGMIQDLISKSERPLKVFISSRSEDDIKRHFASRPTVEIQATDNQGDIEKFVNAEIDRPRQWGPISPSLRRDIVETLFQRSQGMFQWAYLQIKQVLELPTEEDIRNRLGKLPTGLKDAYDEIYAKVSVHKHAKDIVDRACVWVMTAVVPLKSVELLSAIRVDFDQDTLNLASEITESSLLAICSNFLVFDSLRKVWRFSHLSVVEYFEDNHYSLQRALCGSAKVCLRLLLEVYKDAASESEDETSDLEYISDFGFHWGPDETSSEPLDLLDPSHTFQSYLRVYWIDHVKAYEEKLVETAQAADSSLTSLLQSFLGAPHNSSIQYRAWKRQVQRGGWPRPSSDYFQDVRPRDITPASAAVLTMCRFSFYTVLQDWWDNAEITVSQINRKGDSLLGLAALAGCKPICEALIRRGTQLNLLFSGGDYGSALAAASYKGNKEIVELLIQNGAEVNLLLSRGYYGSALAAASWNGQKNAVQLLIENGAEANLQLPGGLYGSALSAASTSPSRVAGILELLIENGAEVNLPLQNAAYESALASACGASNIETAKILIDNGADINLALNGDYGSALGLVSRWGDVELPNLLISNGANVNLLFNGNYGSALAVASRYSQSEMVKFLIDNGANVNLLLNGTYGSALAAASSAGEREVVEVLIDNGADINLVSSGGYGSALAAAAIHGWKEC
ncbi:hypothetical protein EDB81DRAFT_782712 [Dactylonectria macrodidyma]|uniref:NACHT domain-containing protein n=1 Tax=Dactylonectria macrodidyma TaxID=307937 RepID=A0A9P9FFD9_9HYPO|nr:hypothetical protein EDB81DRAFT_782712 [Dactylonectria macrodidyma]